MPLDLDSILGCTLQILFEVVRNLALSSCTNLSRTFSGGIPLLPNELLYTTTPTGYELATISRIEAYSGDPYQLYDVQEKFGE